MAVWIMGGLAAIFSDISIHKNRVYEREESPQASEQSSNRKR